MCAKILVVDDEQTLVDLLTSNLEREGYEVISANDGLTALDLADRQKPDLILLDWMMPEPNGLEVCKQLRLKTKVPIIMLTAKSEEIDKILGLEMGADDYITKPFSPREVQARVRAQLRRGSYLEKDSSSEENVLKIGDLEIDKSAYQIRRNGVDVNLTFREFQLVLFLAENAGQVFSREALLQHVWGYEYFGDVRTVDVTVRRTREKLEPDQTNYRHILTKRGVGYYFEKGQ
ncbi:MAG: response regulator transcription factor [Clostridiales bacterium]|nr:response regulator transcription factor [Clostridiales bacterium]MBR5975565.1 response regulator transcription factor [Clostridiales bacterium]